MRGDITKLVMTGCLMATISACGGDYKVRLEGAVDPGTVAAVTGNDDTTGTTGDTGNVGDGTETDDGTDGGIHYLTPSSTKKDDRWFMGTYNFQTDSSYAGLPSSCDYGLPLTVRAFSYDDSIDFEVNSGELAWTAMVFKDETFDFKVGFLDKLGKPSIHLSCTCADIESPYYGDQIKCACDPSNKKSACYVTYRKMAN